MPVCPDMLKAAPERLARMCRTLFAVTLLALAGCSASKDVPSAERAVASFHSDLNAGAFDAIYAASGTDLKAAATRERFVKVLAAVHRKLGLYKTGKTAGWNDNATLNGHFVTLNVQAGYERGAATEQFVFRVSGDRTLLAGYHVNSDAMLLD